MNLQAELPPYDMQQVLHVEDPTKKLYFWRFISSGIWWQHTLP